MHLHRKRYRRISPAFAGLPLLMLGLAAARGQTPNDRNQLLKEVRLGSVAPASAAAASGPRDPTSPDPRLLESLRGSPTGYTARILIDAQSQAAVKPADRIIELIEMQHVTFTEAARLISEATGLNIAPSPLAGTVPISLYLSHLPATDILESLCNSHGMWFRKDPKTEVYRVFTILEFKQDLASFQEEKTEVFTMKYPTAFDIANAIQDLFGDRVQVTTGQYDEELTTDLAHRLQRFDMIDGRSSGLGMSSSGGGGGRGGGGGGGGGSLSAFGGFGGGSRIARNYQTQLQNQRAQNEVLTADQIQTLQNATASNTNGINQIIERKVSIFVTVLRRQNRLLVRTADQSALNDLRELVAQLDVPTSHVLLEVKVLRIDIGDGFLSSFDMGMDNQDPDNRVNGIFTPGEILPPVLTVPRTVTPGGSGYDPNALVFQYIGQKVRARLQLLETQNKITTLATPMLLTANNEVSRIFVGEERPLNRSFSGQGVAQTGTTTFNTVATSDIEFRPVGNTLLITPNINEDRTVTLRLVQENSSISVKGALVLVPAGAGFTQQRVDTVQTRTISGTFIAQDKLAVVVGGLIEEGISKDRQGIPGLSRLPFIGGAFRRDNNSSLRTELVIIIKPYVLNTPSEAEQISRDLVQEMSIHPKASVLGQGTMQTFQTNEVARPKSPAERKKWYNRGR